MAALQGSEEEEPWPPARVGEFVSFLPTLSHSADDVNILREADLSDIDLGIRKGAHRYVLHGPPGVGKTRLALQFAQRWKATPSYHVHWFSAVDSCTLQLAYQTFADSCWCLEAHNTMRSHPIGEVSKLVASLLRCTRHALFVFDDVEDPSMVEELMEPVLPIDSQQSTTELPDVFVLITTRSSTLFAELPDVAASTTPSRLPCCSKELGGFTPLEAADYLHVSLKNHFSPDVLRLLQTSAELEMHTHQHPLRLRWVSTLLSLHPSTSLVDLLEQLQRCIAQYGAADAILAMVVEALAARDRANDVRGCEMLCHAARLARHPIPMELLQMSMGLNEDAAEAAARSLVSLSLAVIVDEATSLEQEEGEGNACTKKMQFLLLHGAVKAELSQTVALLAQNLPKARGCASAALLNALNALFPLTDILYPENCIRPLLMYLPHVRHVMDALETRPVPSCGCCSDCSSGMSEQTNISAMYLMGKLSKCLMDSSCRKFYVKSKEVESALRSVALGYALKGLAQHRNRLPEGHIDLSMMLHTVASCYYNGCDYENAVTCALEAIDIQRRCNAAAGRGTVAVQGPSHTVLFGCLTFAYMSYASLNQQALALKYGLEALDASRSLFPDGHSETAIALLNVGASFGMTGDLDKELQYMLEGVAMHRRMLGDTHADVAISLTGACSFYQEIEKFELALSCALEAFAIQRQCLPEANMCTIVTLGKLADCYMSTKQFSKALRCKHEEFRLKRLRYGGNPDAEALLAIGYLSFVGHCHSGFLDHQKALDACLKALDMMQGSEAPELLYERIGCTNIISESYFQLGDRENSLKFSLQGLQLLQDFVVFSDKLVEERGLRGASIVVDEDATPVFLHSHINPIRTLESIHRRLAHDSSLWKVGHPESHAIIMKTLALLTYRFAEFVGPESALKYCIDLLNIQRDVLQQDNHPDIAESLCNVAQRYERLNDHDRAQAYALEGLEIMRCNKVHTASSLQWTACALRTVANTYVTAQNYKLGLRYALEALAAQNDAPSKSLLEKRIVLQLIACCYSQLRNDKLALKYTLEALEVQRQDLPGPHPDVVHALVDVNSFYVNAGKPMGAIVVLLEALEMQTEVNPADYNSKLEILYNICVVDVGAGDLKSALKYALEALELRGRLPESTVEFVLPLQTAARCYADLGNRDLALSYGLEALELMPDIHQGDPRPHFSEHIADLAEIFTEYGYHEEACKYQLAELRMVRKVHPDDNPCVIEALQRAALSCAEIGDYAQALQCNSEALQALRKTTHPVAEDEIASILDATARWHISMGNRAQALQHALEALEMRRTVLPDSHPLITSVLSTISLCYTTKFVEA